ncbi:MAG: hypothetical protein HY435_02010 [Candidatus Liptonbacteria bacterium]|nr:hypothetical protein [Candidatus Liptonbacteria bacterium]
MAQSARGRNQEERWFKMLFFAFDILHRRVFGETDITERIVIEPDGCDYVMRYFSPAEVRTELPPQSKRILERRKLRKGQDAFVLEREGFLEYLHDMPALYGEVLGVNGSRPIPKRLLIALLALHECRHKAHARKLVRHVSERNILDRMDGHLPKREHPEFVHLSTQFFQMVLEITEELKSIPPDETDAYLVEALGLYFWERSRTSDLSLLAKHFSRFVLLAPR